MKKKKWAVRVLAALELEVALVLVSGVPGEMQGKRTPEKTVKLVLADNQPEDNCIMVAVEWFAGRVREKTDGCVEISVYNDGGLGDAMSSLEQLQHGAVDIVKTGVSAISDYVGEYHAFLMPHIYQDDAHFWKVHSGEIGMGILRGKQMKEQNMYELCYYDEGARCFYNTKKEIRTPRDMKRMLVRIQESRVMMSMVEALGAQPMMILYSEVYSSLQPDGVSAVENSIVDYLGQSHYQAVPYFVGDNYIRSADMLVMNEKSREKLSEADLGIINEMAEESCEYQKKSWAEAKWQVRKTLEEKDVTITKLGGGEMQEFREICESVWYSYDKGKYNGLVDRIVAADM